MIETVKHYFRSLNIQSAGLGFTRTLCLIGSLLTLPFFGVHAHSAENEIPILVDDFFVEAKAKVSEAQSSQQPISGFENVLGRIGVVLKSQNWLEGHIKLGSQSLAPLPRWKVPATQSFGLVEATIEAKTVAGSFIGGQTLLPFGLDGARDELELVFPREFLYEKSYLSLRDLQFGFKTFSGYWNAQFAVSNGEPTDNTDGRMFFTSKVGFKNQNFWTGIGVMAGRVIPQAGSPSVSGVSGIGLGPSMTPQDHRLKAGNIYLGLHDQYLTFESEVTWLVQESIAFGTRNETLDWTSTLGLELSNHFDLWSRFEGLDPDTRSPDDFVSRPMAALEFHSASRNSRFFVMGIKTLERSQEIPNDEIRFVWRANVVDGIL